MSGRLWPDWFKTLSESEPATGEMSAKKEPTVHKVTLFDNSPNSLNFPRRIHDSGP